MSKVAFIVNEDVSEEYQSETELEVQDQREVRFDLSKSIFVKVIGSYGDNNTHVEQMTEKEFSFIERHSFISAVDLVYKMLLPYADEFQLFGSEIITKDILILKKCLHHLHNHRVLPEYVPGFLILLVKHHYYN